MLPAAGLLVHLLPLKADHVREQAFCQAVLAHHVACQTGPLGGELDRAVGLDRQETVTFHPSHRLRHSGAGLVQALGYPGPQRRHPLFQQLVHCAQVHLRGVDQLAHCNNASLNAMLVMLCDTRTQIWLWVLKICTRAMRRCSHGAQP